MWRPLRWHAWPSGSHLPQPADRSHTAMELIQPSSFSKAQPRYKAATSKLQKNVSGRSSDSTPIQALRTTNLGVTYIRQKRWNDAVKELKTAHLLSPSQTGILLNIGLAYYRQNDFNAAIETVRAGACRDSCFDAGPLSSWPVLLLHWPVQVHRRNTRNHSGKVNRLT